MSKKKIKIYTALITNNHVYRLVQRDSLSDFICIYFPAEIKLANKR